MALGQHLGADQDVDTTGVYLLQQLFQPPLAAGGVAVHARDARLREQGLQRRLDPFGAETEGTQIGFGTAAARVREPLLVAAMV